MFNYLEKIDKNIYSFVTTESVKHCDCIVHAKDYFNFRKKLDQRKFDYIELPFISAFGIKLGLKEVISLAKCKVVNFISKSTKVFSQAFVSKKVLKVDSFYNRGMYGDGGTIAVIDTGVYPHLDFLVPKNRLIKFVDLVDGKDKPYDDNGHGTMVASLALGYGTQYMGKYSGMSPRSNLVVVKAIESSGETASTKILQAMQWVYDNRAKYNIKVCCMSFGSTPSEGFDPLSAGAESLWRAGITVVAAAGNSGPESYSIKSPGINNRIITVGGLDDKRQSEEFVEGNFTVADFSSRGPTNSGYKPDLIAPAVNIVGAKKGGGYCEMSGTSVATPLIAGICSLISSRYPKISPDEIKVRLIRSCKKVTYDRNSEGFGLIDCSNLFNM